MEISTLILFKVKKLVKIENKSIKAFTYYCMFFGSIIIILFMFSVVCWRMDPLHIASSKLFTSREHTIAVCLRKQTT